MNIEFATCERHRALKFIKKVYPSKTITDTPDCAGPLLDLVEKDIVRIQDPMMYGNQIAVSPNATNWKEEYREQVIAACKLFATTPAYLHPDEMEWTKPRDREINDLMEDGRGDVRI